VTTPLNIPEHPPAVTEQGRTAPPSGGSDPSRNERNAFESLGAELLRRAEESQPALEAAWDELMARWGVHGQPLGIQRLRKRIAEECGSKPEDNALSRELIALREERRP
jgi:hypothetical protein